MGAPSPPPDDVSVAPGRMPRRRGELLAVDLGDEQVVYDPRHRHSSRLNRTAGLVLDRCDGRTPIAEVVDELARAFAVDPEQVAGQVGRVLDAFGRDRLVEGLRGDTQALADELGQAWGTPATSLPPPAGSRPAPPGAGDDRGAALDDGDGTAGGGTGEPGLGWRRVLDLAVRFTSPDADLADELGRVFGSLPDEPGGDGRPAERQRRYRLRRADEVVEVWLGPHLAGQATSRGAALSFTQWHLNREAVAGAAGRVLLHAGAVRHPRGLVLLPGETNAGKSTLVAGLVRAGWGYVTDELVGLGPAVAGAPTQATGYRKAISLDPGSWDLFGDVAPPDADQAREWLVEPSALHPDALREGETGSITLVVFPRFEAEAETSTESLSPARALVELIRHDPAAEPLDATGLDALAALARRTPCYRLTTGALDLTIRRVEALARAAAPT